MAERGSGLGCVQPERHVGKWQSPDPGGRCWWALMRPPGRAVEEARSEDGTWWGSESIRGKEGVRLWSAPGVCGLRMAWWEQGVGSFSVKWGQ